MLVTSQPNEARTSMESPDLREWPELQPPPQNAPLPNVSKRNVIMPLGRAWAYSVELSGSLVISLKTKQGARIVNRLAPHSHPRRSRWQAFRRVLSAGSQAAAVQ